MNQMFFGNSRVMLFNPSSGGNSTPAARATTIIITEEDGAQEFLIEGTLNKQWFIDHAFWNHEGMSWAKTIIAIDIGNSVTKIETTALSSNARLMCVTIPNTMTSIETDAFFNCRYLTRITIPDNVTSIKTDAFFNCEGLMSVTITANGGNAANVKQMMINAGCPSNIIWNMPNSQSIRTATRIQYENVYTDYELGNELSPDTLIQNGLINQEAWEYGFIYWEQPPIKIDIGSSIISINDQTFYSTDSLICATIPNSVTSIGYNAFAGCSSLKLVIFDGKDKTTVQNMENYPFGLNYANSDGIIIHCTDGDFQVSYDN